MAQIYSGHGGGDGDIFSLLTRRISYLEADNATLRRQLKVLTAELSLIIEYFGKLGVPVVNTNSVYFNLLHTEDVELDKVKSSLAVVAEVVEPVEPVKTGYSNLGLNENPAPDQVAPTPINSGEQDCVEMEIPTPNMDTTGTGKNFREDFHTGPEPAPASAGDTGEAELAQKDTTKSDQGPSSLINGNHQSPAIDNFTRKKREKCQYCGRTFARQGAKIAHERIHREKPYACRLCKAPFAHPDEKAEHERNCRRSGTRKRSAQRQTSFSCPICDQIFGTKQNMEGHIRRKHTKERPYVCQVCKAAFTDLSGLAQHERTWHS